MKWTRREDTAPFFETPQKILQGTWRKISAHDPLHLELLLFLIELATNNTEVNRIYDDVFKCTNGG